MFQVFKNILKPGYQITEADIQKINSFVMCRWLSGHPGSLLIAQMINHYDKMPVDVQVQLAHTLAGKFKYIPYPKSPKNIEQNLDSLCQYFNISPRIAQEYLEFISEDDLKTIEYELRSKKGK